MTSRLAKNGPGTLSPYLMSVIAALEQDAAERPGEAQALRAFGELALVQIPRRGVFAPADGELYSPIATIADRHLGLRVSRTAFLDATAAVEPFARRDEIQSAANDFQTVSDLAYFYAGLAFGVTFADLRSFREVLDWVDRARPWYANMCNLAYRPWHMSRSPGSQAACALSQASRSLWSVRPKQSADLYIRSADWAEEYRTAALVVLFAIGYALLPGCHCRVQTILSDPLAWIAALVSIFLVKRSGRAQAG